MERASQLAGVAQEFVIHKDCGAIRMNINF